MPGAEPIPSVLSLKRALWIVTAGIAFIQAFGVALWINYDFALEGLPEEFYVKSGWGGVLLYVLFTIVVVADIRDQDIKVLPLLRLEFGRLRPHFSTIAKYFAGCFLTVGLLSIWSGQSELGLEYQSVSTRWLTMFNVVIMAPVFEEVIFRGYLYSAMLKPLKRAREREVVNAMLFAAAHVLLVTFFIGASVPYYIFVLGYLIAHLYEKSRSVLPCIVLHALNNGMVFAIDWLKLEGVLPL